MDFTFRIITPVYNAEQWIGKCIRSVLEQKDENFTQIIIDDGSTDDTLEMAYDIAQGDPRIIIIPGHENRGVMHSHLLGHNFFQNESPEDVFVHLDGDDWLIDRNVLAFVRGVYTEHNVWTTYGNYEATDGSPSIVRPWAGHIRPDAIMNGWPFSHLRTFKKFLWDQLEVEDFLDCNGVAYTAACDTAIMCPILELAEGHVGQINVPLYVYNRGNPLNEDKSALSEQVRCALDVAAKKSKEKYNK